LIQILIELNRRQVAKRADAERNARSQKTTQYYVDEYAPTRQAFEKFLIGGKRELPDFKWKRQETLKTANGQEVVVKAFTDPKHPKFGYRAGNVNQALIGIKVSLVENPDVNQELQLPPVWAILEHDPDFSFQVLDELIENLEDIVPLVRACSPQE